MGGFDVLAANAPEAALRAIEAAHGVTITVRDLDGSLAAIGIDGRRNSHRRQPVCDAGFCERCREHCRTAAGQACQAMPAGLVHTCWKGMREVLVPVQRDGALAGYLFAGAWRGPATPPGPWRAAWRALPDWDAARAAGVAAVLALAAGGLGRLRPPEPAGRGGVIRSWVRAHLAEPGLRAGLARHLGLSRPRTSHVVRETLGCSLEALVAGERLAAARALLAGSTLAVAEVGVRVGWSAPPHFNRTFRRLAGCSPGRWRVRQRSA